MSTPQAIAAKASQSSIVIGTYRALAQLVRRLPEKQRPGAWRELREGYRRNADETSPERISELISEAGKKIAYLRIITPKDMWRSNATTVIDDDETEASQATTAPPGGSPAPPQEIRKDLRKRMFLDDDETEASQAATTQAGVTRWVYKSGGEKDANGEATPRKRRQVVSNFDGNNLDPCSVNRHNYQLKRMGFVNNLHAKGLF